MEQGVPVGEEEMKLEKPFGISLEAPKIPVPPEESSEEAKQNYAKELEEYKQKREKYVNAVIEEQTFYRDRAGLKDYKYIYDDLLMKNLKIERSENPTPLSGRVYTTFLFKVVKMTSDEQTIFQTHIKPYFDDLIDKKKANAAVKAEADENTKKEHIISLIKTYIEKLRDDRMINPYDGSDFFVFNKTLSPELKTQVDSKITELETFIGDTRKTSTQLKADFAKVFNDLRKIIPKDKYPRINRLLKFESVQVSRYSPPQRMLIDKKGDEIFPGSSGLYSSDIVQAGGRRRTRNRRVRRTRHRKVRRTRRHR